MFLKILLFIFVSTTSFAQLAYNSDNSFRKNRNFHNYVINPDAAYNVTEGTSFPGSTLTRLDGTSNTLDQTKWVYGIDAVSAGQKIKFNMKPLSRNFTNNTVEFGFRVVGSISDYQYYIEDGTGTRISQIFTLPTPGRSTDVVQFFTPGSLLLDPYSIVFEAVAVTPGDFKLARLFAGDVTGILFANPATVFSAKVDGTVSPSTVSGETADFINGNCTRTSTGDWDCLFNSGFFQQVPNCIVSPISSNTIMPIVVSTSQISVHAQSGAGTDTNVAFTIHCQRAGSDSPQPAVSSLQADWDWRTETCTGSWSTNTTHTCMSSKVGPNIFIRHKVTVSGAPTSAALTLNLPNSWVIDTTRIPGTISVNSPVGSMPGTILDSGTNKFPAIVLYNSTTSVAVWYHTDAAATPLAAVTQAAPMTFASGDAVEVEYKVPVVGFENSQRALTFAGSVSSLGVRSYRDDIATLNCDASSSKVSDATAMVSSIANAVDNGSNRSCVVTLTTGAFSSIDECSPVILGTTPAMVSKVQTSATSITVYGPDTDYDFTLRCRGPH